jgi:hypothetical protein
MIGWLNKRPVGGTVILLQVDNLGFPSLDSVLVWLGSSQCLNTTQLSQYEVRCTTPSAIGPTSVPVTVHVNGLLSSNNLTFTYMAPVITSIQPVITSQVKKQFEY